MDTYKVKAQPLSEQAFKPHGVYVKPGDRVYPEGDADAGEMKLAVCAVAPKFNLNRLDRLAVNFKFNQTIAVLSGTLVLVLAPPPSNPQAPREKYILDYSRLAAFILNPSDFIQFERGAWFLLEPVGGEGKIVWSSPRQGLPDDSEYVNLVQRGDSPIEVVL